MEVKIKFVGVDAPSDLVVREGMNIPAMMQREGSYVDSPAYATGYKNAMNVGEDEDIGGIYGKSIYATNIYDDAYKGAGNGLIPMKNTTAKFAWFERAVKSAIENGDDDKGITFTIADDDAEAQLYWLQMADNMDDNFAVEVGDYKNSRVEEEGAEGGGDGGNSGN